MILLVLSMFACTCTTPQANDPTAPADPAAEAPAVLLLDRPTPLKGIAAARHHEAPSVRLIPGTEDAWVAWRRGPNNPEIVLARLDAALAIRVGPTPISPRQAGDAEPTLRLLRGAPSVTWRHGSTLYESTLTAEGEPRNPPRALGESTDGAAARLSDHELFWMSRSKGRLHLRWSRGGSADVHLPLDASLGAPPLLSRQGGWVGWVPSNKPGQLHLAEIRDGALHANTLVVLPPTAQHIQLAETREALAVVHLDPAEVRCLGPHGAPRGEALALHPPPDTVAIAARGHLAVVAAIHDSRLRLYGIDLRTCAATGTPVDPTDEVVGLLSRPTVDLTPGEGGLDGLVLWEHRHTPYTAPNIGGRRFSMPTP